MFGSSSLPEGSLPEGKNPNSGLIPYRPYSVLYWVLPPLSISWTINIIGVYIALNRTHNIDCYWGGGSTQLIVGLIKPKP